MLLQKVRTLVPAPRIEPGGACDDGGSRPWRQWRLLVPASSDWRQPLSASCSLKRLTAPHLRIREKVGNPGAIGGATVWTELAPPLLTPARADQQLIWMCACAAGGGATRSCPPDGCKTERTTFTCVSWRCYTLGNYVFSLLLLLWTKIDTWIAIKRQLGLLAGLNISTFLTT